MPSDKALEQWFSDSGVTSFGLICKGDIVLIDIDKKEFGTEDEFNAVVNDLRAVTEGAYWERTQSGGYHIILRIRNHPSECRHIATEANPKQRIGELRSTNGYTLIAPSVGYVAETSLDFTLTVDSIANLGLVFTADRRKDETAIAPTASSASTIATTTLLTIKGTSIRDKVSDAVRVLLDSPQQIRKGGRSDSFYKVATEVLGWENEFTAQKATPTDSVELMLLDYATAIGYNNSEAKHQISEVRRKQSQFKPSLAVYTSNEQWEPPHTTVMANWKAFIKHSSDRFRFNTLTQQLEFDGTAKDTSDAIICVWELMHTVASDPNKVKGDYDRFAKLLTDYAINHCQYNPIADYLTNLPPSTEDLITPLAERMGLNDLETMLLTKWLLQSYHRPLNAGCDAPYMLILYGVQGCGKSSLLNILSKGWIVNVDNLSTDKDTVMKYHSGWLINNDELSTMTKRDTETLKSVITNPEDVMRLPYASANSRFKRFSVFCGTTNNPHILKDDSGNRRFLPIHMRRDMTTEDRQWLTDNIDGLWGYVKHLAEGGMDYHLTKAEADSLTQTQKNYQLRSQTDDLLFGVILWWVNNQATKDQPLSAAIISQLMGQHRQNISSQHIGRKLATLGFNTENRRCDGGRMRCIANIAHIRTVEDVVEYQCVYSLPIPKVGVESDSF